MYVAPMRKIKPLSTTIEAIDKDPLEEVQVCVYCMMNN